MNKLLTIFLTMAVSISASAQDLVTMMVGTYTEGGTSKGVYLYKFNQKTGASRMLSSVSAANPSYIVASPDKRYAYAVSEYNDGRQAVIAFGFSNNHQSLEVIDKKSTTNASAGGEDPCYILTNGKQVVTANYSGGDISVYIKETAAEFATLGDLDADDDHVMFFSDGYNWRGIFDGVA